MIERPDPLENPAGDGPSDTNPLLDELRDGRVVHTAGDFVEVYFHMTEPGRVERVHFAGTPPAVMGERTISALDFSARIADKMDSGRGDVTLTDLEELEERERYHQVASVFRRWRVWEIKIERERGEDDD